MKPEELLEIRNAPFIGREAVWVPNKEAGYVKGVLQGPGGKPGTKKVQYGKENKVKDFPEEQVEPQNPPKYELLEDMANMTYLSEATVINNLNTRYEKFMIYTYSGKFKKMINTNKT